MMSALWRHLVILTIKGKPFAPRRHEEHRVLINYDLNTLSICQNVYKT